jgi:hypothetical protein
MQSAQGVAEIAVSDAHKEHLVTVHTLVDTLHEGLCMFLDGDSTVRVFRQNLTPEDAVGSVSRICSG